jgi:predicted HicB family RNase H-like nuclease
MNETATYPLRLAKSLEEGVTKAAKRDGTTVNQFIAIAVAEKISTWKIP